MSLTKTKIIRIHKKLHVDGNTLVWASNQDVTNRWNRWSAIVSSIDDYKKWKPYIPIAHIVLLNITDADVKYIESENKNNTNIYITQQALTIRPLQYWQNARTVMFIDDFTKHYPNIQPVWDGTVEDAIACISYIFCIHHLVDWNGSDIRKAMLDSHNIRLTTGSVPPAIYVMTQYFVHSNPKRAREIRKCLMNNCSNPLIDKIILLSEEDLSREWVSMRGREKIEQVVIGSRLKYADLIRSTYESVPLNTIVAYMNADIYLDNTIKEVYTLDMRDKMLALLRWNTDELGEEPKLFGPHPDAQDTWIVLSDSIKCREWDYSRFDYQLGRSGCDNRFTADMFANRFIISNPAYTIKTMHIHKSDIRDYNRKDIIPSQYYIYPYPGPILKMNQIAKYDQTICKLDSIPFDIRIRCPTNANGVTWCTMLARHKRFQWIHNEPTSYSVSQPVYEWKDSFVTISGIVYTRSSLYAGPNIDEFAKDSTIPMNVDMLSSKLYHPTVLVIPINRIEVFQNIDDYVLFYMSKVNRLLTKCPDGEFWLPEKFAESISLFKSPIVKSEHRVIRWAPSASAYGNKLIGFLPHVSELCREDIDAIRISWPTWKEVAAPKTCIILVNYTDNTKASPFTADIITGVQEVLGDDWTVSALNMDASGKDAYSALTGKDMCILFNSPDLTGIWRKLWALPRKSHVLEFQNELKITGEFQHMAAASEFDSWIITLHKGDAINMRDQAIKYLREWMKDTYMSNISNIRDTISLAV